MEKDLMPAVTARPSTPEMELKFSIRDLISAKEEKDFLVRPVLIRSA